MTVATMLAMFAAGAAAQEAAGKWAGVVKAPGAELPIIVTVAKAADGTLSGGLESPTQAQGMVIPIDTIKADEELFSFTIPSIQGDFMGVWQDEVKSWSGAWTQSGRSFPLELKPAN